ncbi:hypothetical protein HK101_008002, partial [Irineochytrium annulatum]
MNGVDPQQWAQMTGAKSFDGPVLSQPMDISALTSPNQRPPHSSPTFANHSLHQQQPQQQYQHHQQSQYLSSAAAVAAEASGLTAKAEVTISPILPHQQPLPHETFYGFIDSANDALMLMEASRIGGLGILQRVKGRLNANDKNSIRSGSVFVFDQEESKIKRWTDGMNWSPSRIHNGCFLIYRQIVKADEAEATALVKTEVPLSVDRDLAEPGFNAQLKDAMVVKQGGMVKKTISLVYGGRHIHVISYYKREDVISGLLPVPSRTDRLGYMSETLLRSSLTKTIPLRENATSPATSPNRALGRRTDVSLLIPPRTNSEGSNNQRSGSREVGRGRGRSRSGVSISPVRSPVRGRSFDKSPTSASSTGSNPFFLQPPDGSNVPQLSSLVDILATSPSVPNPIVLRKRNMSPSSIYSASPPTTLDIDFFDPAAAGAGARYKPYDRRDSTSSNGSSHTGGDAYQYARRRASSRSNSISPIIDGSSLGSGGPLWDSPSMVEMMLSPSSASVMANVLPPPGFLPGMRAGHATPPDGFRFEVTAPDDDPHNLATQRIMMDVLGLEGVVASPSSVGASPLGSPVHSPVPHTPHLTDSLLSMGIHSGVPSPLIPITGGPGAVGNPGGAQMEQQYLNQQL